MDEPLFITVLILAVPVFWVAIMAVIARIGGWSALAEHYRTENEFEGQRWRFESARFNWRSTYSSCLTFGANARGLHLSTLFLFRLSHPPLFIPWSDVTMRRKTMWRFPYVELHFRRVPDRPLLIREKLGEQLATVARFTWPPEEQRS